MAYDQASGAEKWRFWAAPLPGEPGSETWKATAIDHSGAPTWMSGSYDVRSWFERGKQWEPAAQKANFAANCRMRGSPALRILPNVAEFFELTGKLKFV